ncbi:cadherin EGF LAG seven-pass G-type receptor 2-like isoform X1 [Mytilus californianus]|uniref:cadherin EGF LAG seven-pass G-type receptor 2-like isoform X1 n=2 Tax=Mytilus californianus TaxID=6549 RepID=UPI0022474299|nr:cadherin EGF LAG seven-pass G-type receptor 2-like isoform X1 [Mytilus californianus]
MDGFSNISKKCALYIFVSLILNVSYIYCVLIKVSDHLIPGTKVFDSQHGKGWSYSIYNENLRDFSNDFLVINSKTGAVYLNKPVNCEQYDNPMYYSILSKKSSYLDKSSNISRTPLKFILEGQKCKVPNHRKFGRRKVSDIHHIVVQKKFKKCFTQYQNILTLLDFTSFNHQSCKILDVSFDSQSYSFKTEIGAILTTKEICFKSSNITVFANVLVSCKNILEMVPISILLQNMQDSGNFDVMSFEEIDMKFNIHRRFRRQTENKEPSFAQTQYIANVKEEQNPGVTVISITANDPDSGDAGTLTYTMSAQSDQRSDEMFAINPITGTVNTTKKLDRELIQTHYFKVVATDNGDPQRNAYTLLIVKVNDVNDHKPAFDQNVYYQNLQENVQLGTTVITIRATDGDQGDNAVITYRIINPTGNNDAFMIDPSSGSVTTKQTIDREKIDAYQLLIQAIDNADVTSRMSSTATLNIKVLDENDNKPVFNQTSYTVTISEDHNYSTDPVIATVLATDMDSGVNKLITYDIIGDTGNTFSVNRNTGQLSLLRSLDYESKKEYVVNIRATDGGSPPEISTVTVTIDVKDVNDNDPEFYSAPYQESVLENVAINSSVVFVAAHDADSNENGEIEYSIINMPVSFPFRINPRNGEIIVKSALDREAVENYNFVVMAKDKGNPRRSATTNVQITIRDVNDNNPKFVKKFYNASVPEDAPITHRILNVMATDSDAGENALITYSIYSGDNLGMFRISPSNGEGLITLAGKLDFKVQGQYILTIRATDSQGLFDTAEVVIKVLDTNQNRPEFQGTPYTFQVDENTEVGTSVYKVLALDKDSGENARISYQLHDTTNFAIDANTGVITTRVTLDREVMQGTTFVVTASDHGIPALTATTDIQVHIGDVNDNAPIFNKISYIAAVREDVTVGTLVVEISASDKDIDQNAKILYTFDNGNSGNGDFEIDGGSGKIRTAKLLDREVVPVYHLKAFAKDLGVPSQSTAVNITINVQDVNDNSPDFGQQEKEIYVPENTPIKTVIDYFSASDPDEGANAIVEYEIQNTLDFKFFELDYKHGEQAKLKNLIKFDYESNRKRYQIEVLATSTPFFSRLKININVQDVNDNKPVLKDFSIIFNNYDEKFITGVIGRIPAYDPDESDRNKLVYNFTLGNEANFLHLNSTTGEITLDDRLNSDIPRNGTLKVKVSDGLNEAKATCYLYVRYVSMEMLQNSVTIRLSNMTIAAFMSPLYDFFVDALANILKTEDRFLYVINIENDTDVKSQVLNVSVSVKKNDGSFYNAEYIQEQIYIHRVILAELSTLEVLPFDDNECLVEMCPYFDNCISSLSYGSAEPFVSSDMMLFRPIRPGNGYKCVCPLGFAGNSSAFCSLEVDLCYSNPCRNNGQCIRKEGGFTCKCAQNFAGKFCEINTKEKFDVTNCPNDLCQNSFPCVPLINGGFRCDGCQQIHYNEFCQLTTRRFTKGSYLTFPSLKSRNRFKIELRFATQAKNALLFYNGRFNEKHDYIALEIIDEQVQFSFSLGNNTIIVNTNVQGGVSNGEWTWVSVDYLNRTATLTVGEDCDTAITVKYGHRLSSTYRCAAEGKSVLPTICDNPSESCFRLFDLTGPLQIGGLPKLPAQFQIQTKDFDGCIKDFYLDNALLDLNQSVASVGTSPGCDSKKHFCIGDPCKNGGTCYEGWGTYICQCGPNKKGKDCTVDISEGPRRLEGTGYLSYQPSSLPSPTIYLDWHNGISFRTRSTNGVLMHIVITGGISVLMQLEDGYIHYNYTDSNGNVGFVFDHVKVNDGSWHYFEVRWLKVSSELIQILDYGHWTKTFTIQSTIAGKQIQQVIVGGQRQGTGPVINQFTGCVQNALVGNNGYTGLTKPDVHQAREGCVVDNPCSKNPCSNGATCVDEWEQYSCKCPPGTIGPNCQDICQNYNPCENFAFCRSPSQNLYGYHCECGELQSGQYCDEVLLQPCPDNWYGFPICGPCNCPEDKGFSGHCGTTKRECRCKSNHYRPVGSDRCFPCDCYMKGAINDTCHPVTGQCPCMESVIGRQCNQCESPYAGITLQEKEKGCTVVYDVCPRNYLGGVWWDGTQHGYVRIRDCPHGGKGDAKRNCSHETRLWDEPDFTNCTSSGLTKLLEQIRLIEEGKLKLNPFVAKTTMKTLAESLQAAQILFGQDLDITYRIIMTLLDYELKQTGMNLTSEQDGKYVQNLLDALSVILDPQYSEDWKRLQTSDVLLQKLETYTEKLLTTLDELHKIPYSVVSARVVLMMDTVNKSNFSSLEIPKFDNIVQKSTYDDETHVDLPSAVLFSEQSVAAEENPALISQIFENRHVPQSHIAFVMYKTLGNLLPNRYQEDVRIVSDRPVNLNAPLVTIKIRDQGQIHSGGLKQPIKLTFKQAVNKNRTDPQCVFWQFNGGGQWSNQGCSVDSRYELDVKEVNPEDPTDVKVIKQMYVVCSCNHMTSFGLMMDEAEKEYVAEGAVSLEVVCFVGVGLSMIALLVTFIILVSFKHIQCNSNTILINLVFVIFLAELAFIVGVYRVESKQHVWCKLVAIALHFFHLSAFSWLFVEMLHLYRRLVEIREINYGAMKFYYLIGYVVPGIVVGFSVGLYTDAYGTSQFCWLDITQPFIWTFAGPVMVGALSCIVVTILGFHATTREKVHVSNISSHRCRILCGVFLLLLLGLNWIIGLLSVNYDSTALYYVYAVVVMAQGLFMLLAYVIGDTKVRSQVRRQWLKCQGRNIKSEENLVGKGVPVSRSALAYRNDASYEGNINRISVGITASSTTSRSTSKNSGGLFKGEDYLCSTTSTSGHVPGSMYPNKKTALTPYAYDTKAYMEKRPKEQEIDETGRVKHPNDSDSDSDASEGNISLELASSHSSDEDDDDDNITSWEKQMSKNKIVEDAKEQIRKKKREKEDADKQIPVIDNAQMFNNNPQFNHWPGDPHLANHQINESDFRPSDQYSIQHTMSSVPPDVTLHAQEFQGNRDYIIPPTRMDSLLNDSSSISKVSSVMANLPSERVKVQVLTHNGSISSDSECSNETTV